MSAPVALVTDDSSMQAGIGRIIGEHGRIDVLVNNAGYGAYGAVEDVPIDEARRQFDVNVFGLARLVQRGHRVRVVREEDAQGAHRVRQARAGIRAGDGREEDREGRDDQATGRALPGRQGRADDHDVARLHPDRVYDGVVSRVYGSR